MSLSEKTLKMEGVNGDTPILLVQDVQEAVQELITRCASVPYPDGLEVLEVSDIHRFCNEIFGEKLI